MVGPTHLPCNDLAEVPFGQSKASSADMNAKIHNSVSGITYRTRVNLRRQHNRSRHSDGVNARSRPEWIMGITQKRRSHFANATRRRRFMANAWP